MNLAESLLVGQDFTPHALHTSRARNSSLLSKQARASATIEYTRKRQRFIPNPNLRKSLIIPQNLNSDESTRKSGINTETDLLQKLGSKAITKEELLRKVEQDFSLLPAVLKGTSSSKAIIRYGCAKVLMDLSEKYPEKLYPYIDDFIVFLDSKYRILTWNAMAIIADLTKVDRDRKFDAIFDKYYGFLNNEYMVTAANVVGNSAKIALAKPHLVQRITTELLKVENIKLTPHLTAECKRVIIEHTIKSFDVFFEKIEAKEQVLSLAKKQLHSTRTSLRKEAQRFLEKWD